LFGTEGRRRAGLEAAVAVGTQSSWREFADAVFVTVPIGHCQADDVGVRLRPGGREGSCVRTSRPASRLLHPGELRVGTCFVNPPFQFIDKGARVGFEIELIGAIAQAAVSTRVCRHALGADLAARRVGAVMKVYPVAAYLTRQTPGLKIVAQVPADPQPLGIGFNRDNPGLLAAVNGALASLESDGAFRNLAAKWHLADQT
jgi:ABC-type amino acid transport substrate-binding protein